MGSWYWLLVAQQNPKHLCKLPHRPTTVASVGYVPLPEEAYHLDEVHFTRGKVGTVFAGEAEVNLTIGELLRKQAKF